MEVHEILTALAAIIGAIAGTYSILQQKRKVEAEAKTDEATAADIIQGASKDLIEQYIKRYNEVAIEYIPLKNEIIEYKLEILNLKEEIICLKEEIICLKQEIVDLKSEIVVIKAEITTLKAELELSKQSST